MVVHKAQRDRGGLSTLLSELTSSSEISPFAAWEEGFRKAADGAQYSSSLVKGLLVLAHFAGGELVSITDLAARLKMTPSTTHRYLYTLFMLGLVEQDPATRKYRLAS